MLLTPRTYSLAQTADHGRTRPEPGYFLRVQSQRERQAEQQRARRMLLVHQTGSVKVGEVVRWVLHFDPFHEATPRNSQSNTLP